MTKNGKELLLRCDCGTEIVAIDLWLSQGADAKDSELSLSEESYLTFYNDSNPPKGFINRIKAAWKMLRGDPYTFSCVILKPEDVVKLADFLKDFTTSSNSKRGGE